MSRFTENIQDLLAALRLSARRLGRSRIFAITTIATFALGIAANSAIFTLVNALVLRPLAIPELHRVVSVAEQHGGDYPQQVSLPDYLEYSRESRSFEQLAARLQEDRVLTLSGESEQVHATRCTSNLFRVFQLEPQTGRVFSPAEDHPGADGEVVLTHAFWQSHFGGSAAAVGRDIVLDGRQYTIIGVMPQSFDHVGFSDLYLPLAATSTQENDRAAREYTIVGRMRDGVSPAVASAELNAIAAQIAQTSPNTNAGYKVLMRPLVETINGDLTPTFLRLVFAATLVLMLVVCANISNLQLAYTLRRAPEFAIRFAMGSTRKRLLRDLLVDSLVQSLLGSAAGLLLASLLLHVMLAEMPARISSMLAGWSNIHLDVRTLAYSIVAAVVAGMIAGLLPALAGARPELLGMMKSGGRSVRGSRGTRRLRNLLAGGQITLAIALVAGAACVAVSMFTMLGATQRFGPNQALVFDTYLPPARYDTSAKQVDFFRSSLERLSTVPGVRTAAFTTGLPYDNNGVLWQGVKIVGDPVLPGQTRTSQRLTVSPEFFSMFGMHILDGRSFTSTDSLEHPLVAVISQQLARQYFGDRNPLGRQIQMGNSAGLTAPATVVGVVSDIVYAWVDQVSRPTVYFSYAQMPVNTGTYVLRTAGDATALASTARRTMAELDSVVAVDPPETYAAYLHESLIGLSYIGVMLAADAVIALLLSGIGLFGVMTNVVTERTYEIGIRFAVGASRSSVLLLLMKRSAIIIGSGSAVGLMLAFSVGRILSSLLRNISDHQMAIVVGSTVVVGLLSLLAAYLPARRALTIDPVEALRVT